MNRRFLPRAAPSARHSRPASRHSTRGFSLIEVLVAMLVVAIGLLGLAKMQALTLVSSQTARTRTIVAMRTASLASAMQANRAFWGQQTAAFQFNASGAAVQNTSHASLQTAQATCTGAAAASGTTPLRACDPAQLAAFDYQQWVTAMNGYLPGFTSDGTCSAATAPSAASATSGAPVQCVINVRWTEKFTTATRDAASSSAATDGDRSFTLHVVL